MQTGKTRPLTTQGIRTEADDVPPRSTRASPHLCRAQGYRGKGRRIRRRCRFDARTAPACVVAKRRRSRRLCLYVVTMQGWRWERTAWMESCKVVERRG